MLLLLPLLTYAACVVLARRLDAWQTGGGWRDAIVAGLVGVAGVVAAGTELLSLPHALRSAGISVLWSVAAIVACSLAYRRLKTLPTRRVWSRTDAWETAAWGAAAGVALLLLVVAICAAPSNWDSMTYHLPRVCHWLQNGSVAHYPTHNLRQLHLGPMAEYGLLHVMALSGGDRFVTLVQWSCMVGACVAASLVAGQLGASRWGQALATLCCVTIPMGILQSSSTQNDYVAAVLVLCSIYYLLRIRGDRTGRDVVLGALAIGLAILTKPTALIFIAPFVMWAAVRVGRGPCRWRTLACSMALGLGIITVLNVGHMWRNWALFGAPLGIREPVNPDIYSNDTFGWRVLVSNLVRNAAIHMQVPFDGLRATLLRAIRSVHAGIGMDVSSPDTTFMGTHFGEGVLTMTQNGDLTGNTLHGLLLILCAGLLLFRRPPKEVRMRAGIMLGCLAAAFLMFCGYLKWQPWHSRLHLPLFVAAAPVMGAVIGTGLRRRTGAVLAGVLLLASTPWMVRCSTRPLLARQSIMNTPRLVQQFVERPALMRGYVDAAIRLTEEGYEHIGLVLGADDWEYPLWSLLRAGGSSARIHNVSVRNISSRCPGQEPLCDVIVRIDNARPWIDIEPGKGIENVAD